jgi:hypothetical protein
MKGGRTVKAMMKSFFKQLKAKPVVMLRQESIDGMFGAELAMLGLCHWGKHRSTASGSIFIYCLFHDRSITKHT